MSPLIKVLECVQKKMSRMAPEEAARYRLDDCLGGNSPTIHQRAIRRIYGEKASDIIDGLKRNPVVAVPLVLRRLKAKDEEWRDVQKVRLINPQRYYRAPRIILQPRGLAKVSYRPIVILTGHF